jgi:hypothetical protein
MENYNPTADLSYEELLSSTINHILSDIDKSVNQNIKICNYYFYSVILNNPNYLNLKNEIVSFLSNKGYKIDDIQLPGTDIYGIKITWE